VHAIFDLKDDHYDEDILHEDGEGDVGDDYLRNITNIMDLPTSADPEASGDTICSSVDTDSSNVNMFIGLIYYRDKSNKKMDLLQKS
jgi:hypothetical protein